MVYIATAYTATLPGGITIVTGLEDIESLLIAAQIDAQAAADLTAAFAQSAPPDQIYVATYDSGSEDPTDALDAMVSAGNAFGVIAQESRTDTDNALVGAWLDASVDRRWRMVAVLQTESSDIVTSGKPSALSDCEVVSVIMCAHSKSEEPMAAAVAGAIAGHRMTVKPLPLHIQIQGVELPEYTSAEIAFAQANDACVLVPAGTGASASIRLLDQTRTYAGYEAAAVFTLIYLAARCIVALSDMAANKAARYDILRADAAGATEVRGVLDVPCAALAATSPSHFTAGSIGSGADEVALPDGYSVEVSPSGTELSAQIITRFGPEATGIGLDLEGLIVQEG